VANVLSWPVRVRVFSPANSLLNAYKRLNVSANIGVNLNFAAQQSRR
jgi:hypothetical protein